MKTKQALIISLAAFLSFGCAKDPEKVEFSTNPKIAVATLFTHDGCTVYRFDDDGRNHYFARCGTEAETISPKTTACGKGCFSTWDENIRTNDR